MSCLLKRRSITGSPFSPVAPHFASSSPPGIVGMQLFLLCHSSVPWFKSSGYTIHRHTQKHTHRLPRELNLSFLLTFFFLSPHNNWKPIHTLQHKHLPKNTINTECLSPFFFTSSHTHKHIHQGGSALLCMNATLVSPPLSCDWTVNVAGGTKNRGRWWPTASTFTFHFQHSNTKYRC